MRLENFTEYLMDLVHGHFEISIIGDTIYTELKGTFNEHGVIAWSNGMKEAIGSFHGQAFTILVNELAVEGATPEALSEGEKYNQWLNHQKMKAKAVVYSSDMLRDIDKKNLPARNDQHIRFFDNVSDAKCWLAKQ